MTPFTTASRHTESDLRVAISQSRSVRVTAADLLDAKLGPRFGRLDLCSQLTLLAVESLAPHFDTVSRHRIGICLAVRAGSISTDIEYWSGRDGPGGPSPTLFAYTLPSAAIGEIAIRYRLTGPNLCLVGDAQALATEGLELIRQGEADGCICIWCNAITPLAAEMIAATPVAEAQAFFLVDTNSLNAAPARGPA